MKVLVTGANGFVGRHFLSQCDAECVAVVRSRRDPADIAIGDMARFEGWRELFQGVDVIVHLAARVHQMSEDDPAAYHRDNVEVVERMARAAVASGVKRFIFLSSIKVNGELTHGRGFAPEDALAPEDPYGCSKAEAEQRLFEFSRDTDLEVVVIRPPLVYGPGVKANFSKLLGLSRLPLPFASVANRRDMVSVYNLCDLIVSCIEHPEAAGQVFMVSDGRPYSLAELLRTMARVQGGRSWLWPFPVSVMAAGLKLLGRQAFAQRLFSDLEVDIGHTVETLGWQPAHSLESTLRKML